MDEPTEMIDFAVSSLMMCITGLNVMNRVLNQCHTDLKEVLLWKNVLK